MNEWTWDTHITITMNYFTVFFVVSLNLCKALTTEWQACPSNTGRHFKELNWCHKSELCSIVIWSTYCLPGEVLPRSIAYRDMDYLAEPFFYFIFFFLCVCVYDFTFSCLTSYISVKKIWIISLAEWNPCLTSELLRLLSSK